MQVLQFVFPLLLVGGVAVPLAIIITVGRCYAIHKICETKNLSDEKAKAISKIMSNDTIGLSIKRTDN